MCVCARLRTISFVRLDFLRLKLASFSRSEKKSKRWKLKRTRLAGSFAGHSRARDCHSRAPAASKLRKVFGVFFVSQSLSSGSFLLASRQRARSFSLRARNSFKARAQFSPLTYLAGRIRRAARRRASPCRWDLRARVPVCGTQETRAKWRVRVLNWR